MDGVRVIKRNGEEVMFHKEKIVAAVSKANAEAPRLYQMNVAVIEDIADQVEKQVKAYDRAVDVEMIQDLVEKSIMEHRAYEVAQLYVRYRFKKNLARKSNTTDNRILSLISCKNEEIKQENSNKNPTIISTQRDYMAGEVSKDLCERLFIPKDIWEAHKDGRIHFHDSDYFIHEGMNNCCLINLEDMLQNGTVISKVKIDKPNGFLTTCTVATQIAAQAASSQYGGQTLNLGHISAFVDVSRQKLRKKEKERLEKEGIFATEEQINAIAEDALKDEIRQGVQTIQYQVTTLQTTNGQAPFISIFMYLNGEEDEAKRRDLAMVIEEVLRQRIQGVKNSDGVWVNPAFPKLLYVLDASNDYGCEYEYLTDLAVECSAVSGRMVPDYISEKKMLEQKGDVYGCMGCRSFLTPDRTKENLANDGCYKPGKKYWGRFNQGVVTLNLVDIALASSGDYEMFWEIMEDRLENLCHKALRCRHERLLGATSDIAPIMWQHGALARLQPGEKIDRLLFDGYSTISLGYAGLYECTYYMTGYSHTSPEGKDFALSVMRKLNEACNKWKQEENIDYSVYGTPIESTTYKFAKCLQEKYGIVDGVTDKNYITNSYHVNVREEIDAFTKLEFESQFQDLSPGGAISYVEIPNLKGNKAAARAIVDYIRDNIMYAELNTRHDYCFECGYTGEIKVVQDAGKLVWECPCCQNRDQTKMYIPRRTCGYVGTEYWNQGRTQEINERVLHL